MQVIEYAALTRVLGHAPPFVPAIPLLRHLEYKSHNKTLPVRVKGVVFPVDLQRTTTLAVPSRAV